MFPHIIKKKNLFLKVHFAGYKVIASAINFEFN